MGYWNTLAFMNKEEYSTESVNPWDFSEIIDVFRSRLPALYETTERINELIFLCLYSFLNVYLFFSYLWSISLFLNK